MLDPTAEEPQNLVVGGFGRESTDNRVTQQTVSPSEQVFSTPELLDTIVAFFKGGSVFTRSEIHHRTPECGEPRLWKRDLVPLLTVNSTFFQVSAAVVWDGMHSLGPFIYLLVLSSAAWGSTGVAEGTKNPRWARLKTYFSSTRSLILDDLVGPPMAQRLLAPLFRPSPVFPRLKELTLASPNPLAITIVASAHATLEKLDITFDLRHGSIAAAQLVSAVLSPVFRSSSQLTRLSLTNVTIEQSNIINISKILSLRRLFLRLSSSDIFLLLLLTNLKLESLGLDIAPSDPAYRPTWEPLSVSTLNQAIAHGSFPTLQCLVVSADCRSQLEMALVFSRPVLKSLELTLVYNVACPETTCVTALLSVYLIRGTTLESLTVAGILPQEIHDPSIDPPTSNRTSDWTSEFLARLSDATNLQKLDVQNTLFSSPDVVLKVLRLLPRLERLKVFRFTPRIGPPNGAHLDLPSLDDLIGIALYNPSLTSLSIPVGAQSFRNRLPTAFSSHRLEFFTLIPYPDVRLSSLPLHSKLHLGLFLHSLFPFVRSLAHHSIPGSAQWNDWKLMETVLATYQHVHARAVQGIQPH